MFLIKIVLEVLGNALRWEKFKNRHNNNLRDIRISEIKQSFSEDILVYIGNTKAFTGNL